MNSAKLFFSADSPDNSLRYLYWDIQFAPHYDDASSQFQTGFRDEQYQQFRWVAFQDEKMEAKMCPVYVHFLYGPPCAWDAQSEGTDCKLIIYDS